MCWLSLLLVLVLAAGGFSLSFERERQWIKIFKLPLRVIIQLPVFKKGMYAYLGSIGAIS